MTALPIFETEVENKETGELETAYFISLAGGGDTSETEVRVTKTSIKQQPKEIVVDWSDLVAQ